MNFNQIAASHVGAHHDGKDGTWFDDARAQWLGRAQGVALQTLQFENNAWGRPALLPPAPLHFNISHTEGLVLGALQTLSDQGNTLVAQGRVADVQNTADSQTGRYLLHAMRHPLQARRRVIAFDLIAACADAERAGGLKGTLSVRPAPETVWPGTSCCEQKSSPGKTASSAAPAMDQEAQPCAFSRVCGRWRV